MRIATLSLLGLLALPLALVGCGGEDGYEEADKGKEVEKEPETGPHGGHVLHPDPHDTPVHLEVVFDEEAKLATLYVVEEKEGKFVERPIADESISMHYLPEDADEELELVFAAQREEGAEETAMFQLPADQLPAAFEHEEDLSGHIHLTIDGKEYVYDVEPHEHGEHGHEHDDDEEDAD